MIDCGSSLEKTLTEKSPYLNRIFTILLLIAAGECIFFLPFVIPRIFRPTVLDVFSVDNTQLGICFSVYGVVALISYFFGGIVADKYQPRVLMAFALFLTGIGGFYFATYPPLDKLMILYGWWGFTTIFLFWSALIKATRLWGGSISQGKAFGFLDGGRGTVSAGIAVLGVVIFSFVMAQDIDQLTHDQRQDAFKSVIHATSVVTLLTAVIVFFFLKIKPNNATQEDIIQSKFSKEKLLAIAKLPFVWLLALIILCAYCGYKVTDIFSLTANEVMGYDELKSSKVGTMTFYMRPIIGLTIGFLADRTKPSKVLILSFLVTLIGAFLFGSGLIESSTVFLFFLSLIITSIGVYSARVLYFAVIEEGNIPLALTGTTVGLVSIIGYTPDIFMGPVTGYLLDSSPGPTGHRHVYLMLALFSFIGLCASIFLRKSVKS